MGETEMDVQQYKQTLQIATFGFTYNKIILNDTGDPIDYIFLDTNPAYEGMLGLTHQQIVHKRVTEIFTDLSEDPVNWIERFGRVAISGESSEFEAFSGSLHRWFQFLVLSPEYLYFSVISFDITEKRHIQQKLRQTETRKQLYFDSAPDGIFIIDRRHYTDVNPAACRQLGYTRDEFIKLNISDIIPEAEFDIHQKTLTKIHSDGHASRKARLKRKDGSLITVILDTVALEDGSFMAFCKDITTQQKIEQEKEQYYTAFQSISQPVLITDARGRILSINKAFTGMYGISEQEALGKTPNIMNPGRTVYNNLGITDQEYDHLFKSLWTSVKDPEICCWEGVVINRHKNGKLIWVKLLVNGIYDERRELSSIVGLPFDITFSRELENKSRLQLYQTIADLAELRDNDTGNHMRRVGLFAKQIAHELGMTEKFCNDIEIFAPMHDIGKVGIADSILLAPRRLTPEEIAIMQTHTTLGHNIVKDKKEFKMAADITLYHHERFDGSGYPKKFSGQAIPLSARITALADVYDALRSKRPYKVPWSHERAAEYIQASAGTHFDPEVVAAFKKTSAQFNFIYNELID